MFTSLNMLMIGSNSRNAGKTTLACKAISKWSNTHRVIGLKVTSIRQGESKMHGTHSETDLQGFSIIEENQLLLQKDTSLMLAAGADKVYYIRTTDDNLSNAYAAFLELEPGNPIIVSESRNLRTIVKPGALVMLMRIPPFGNAKDVSEYLNCADKIFEISEFIESAFDTIVDQIEITPNNEISVKATA